MSEIKLVARAEIIESRLTAVSVGESVLGAFAMAGEQKVTSFTARGRPLDFAKPKAIYWADAASSATSVS